MNVAFGSTSGKITGRVDGSAKIMGFGKEVKVAVFAEKILEGWIFGGNLIKPFTLAPNLNISMATLVFEKSADSLTASIDSDIEYNYNSIV